MNLKTMQQLSLTPAQLELARKHGTPPQFAASVWAAVPGDISSDEAQAAIDQYQREWAEAGKDKPNEY